MFLPHFRGHFVIAPRNGDLEPTDLFETLYCLNQSNPTANTKVTSEFIKFRNGGWFKMVVADVTPIPHYLTEMYSCFFRLQIWKNDQNRTTRSGVIGSFAELCNGGRSKMAAVDVTTGVSDKNARISGVCGRNLKILSVPESQNEALHFPTPAGNVVSYVFTKMAAGQL